MARVLRPDGRVVAVDTDWGSLWVDVGDDDLTRRVLARAAVRMPRPRVAFALRRLLTEAGLTNVTIEPYPFLYTSLAEAAVLLPMLNEDVPQQAGFFAPEDRAPWFAALHRADERGILTAGWNAYIAVGHRKAAGTVG
jgi:hypothetical protein